MKTFLFKITVITLLVTGIFSSCKEKNTLETPLANTKWKLVGIVDAETGKLTELEPQNCNECYRLEFDKEPVYFCYPDHDMPSSMYFAQAVELSFWGCYNINHTLSTLQFIGVERPDMEDIYDGEFYYEIMLNVHAFELKGSELKLHYNDKKKYLMYEEAKQ